MISSGTDVVGFLKEQHEQIKTMFADVIAARGEERQRAFIALRRLLAVHETAEEEIVHPAARRALPDGEAIVDARLKEENEAKKALTELEKLDVDSAEFDTKFQTPKSDVIAHAESEEQDGIHSACERPRSIAPRAHAEGRRVRREGCAHASAPWRRIGGRQHACRSFCRDGGPCTRRDGCQVEELKRTIQTTGGAHACAHVSRAEPRPRRTEARTATLSTRTT